MEDKQILELFWERSQEAIPETINKYGQDSAYLANHILQDTEVAKRCVDESMQILWDTIPPHRPQNLKAYVCKVTRNHALHMKYPELEEQASDLFSAEIIIQEFLKGIEVEQRKIYVAHYWYFTPVDEIAKQYKMSESKVNKTLQSIRQSLDERLNEKQVGLQVEEEFLYALTEIDDRYLVEAEPLKEKETKSNEDTNPKVNQKPNGSINDLLEKLWNKKMIGVMAGVACVVLLAFLWPKDTIEPITPSTESENSEGTNEAPDKIQTGYEGILIHIVNGEYYSQETYEYRKSLLPWNMEMEVAALPVYKNLAYADIEGHQYSAISVFLDEDTLVAMVEDIASKVDMQVVHTKINKTTYKELKNIVYGIEATTDKGSIKIEGDGRVYVNFFEGVQLPKEYEMKDSATIEQANATVSYLLEQYGDLFPSKDMSPNCYDAYDNKAQRYVNYQAVARVYSAEGIDDYYFNQVQFEYNEQLGLTGISYGDVRSAAELVGYYPIISVEEAKEILVEGKGIEYEIDFARYDVALSDLEDTSYVELIYNTPNQNLYYYFAGNKYYQPFYCFYVKMGSLEEYCRFYVPAIKGATENEIPEQSEITILDISEYHVIDGIYQKDGKYYKLDHGEMVETEYVIQNSTEDYSLEYGEAVGEFMEDGSIQWKAYYKGEEVLNLDEAMSGIGSVNPDSYEIRYLDGDIIIICFELQSGEQYATVFLYKVDGTLQRLTDSIKMCSMYDPTGLSLTTGLHGLVGNEAKEVMILDLQTGQSVNTGIKYEDVEAIGSASDEHFAVVYKTGEIAIVEKTSGQIIKKTKYPLNFTPYIFVYEDDMLYVESMESPNLVFVIKDFE